MSSRQQFQPGQKPVCKTGILFRHWEWVKLCCIKSLQQLIAHTLKRYWKITFESVLFLFLAIKRLTILDLLKALGSLTLAIIALNSCLKPSIYLSSSMFWYTQERLHLTWLLYQAGRAAIAWSISYRANCPNTYLSACWITFLLVSL